MEGAVALCLDFTSNSDLVTVIEAGERKKKKARVRGADEDPKARRCKEEEAHTLKSGKTGDT